LRHLLGIVELEKEFPAELDTCARSAEGEAVPSGAAVPSGEAVPCGKFAEYGAGLADSGLTTSWTGVPEGNGNAGTVGTTKSLGKGGTEGTAGSAGVGTDGMAGTDGTATVGLISAFGVTGARVSSAIRLP
jgi:hypothetical protein